MKDCKRAIAFLLLAVLLVLPLAGCGGEQRTTMTLQIAAPDMPDSLDPAQVDTDTEKTIVTHLYENLMKMTENGPVPALAKSYVCTDNLDGTETYTFTLRNDVKWSDGKTVTADDFVYAWQRLVDPATASPNRELMNMVMGYDAAAAGDLAALCVRAEGNTLVVELNCHCSYFLSSICTDAATMPVPYGIDENGTEWGTRIDSLVTNGAYRIVALTDRDRALTIREAEDYYDSKRISVSEMTFHVGMTREKAMAAFENGEMDIVLDSDAIEEAIVSYKPEVTTIIINQMTGTLQQESLRLALSKCLDRNVLCEYAGESYLPADGLVPYGTASTEDVDFRSLGGAVIDNSLENYDALCDQARQGLEEIGYTEVMRSSLNTLTLIFENTPEQTEVAHAIQQMWNEQLGIQVTLVASSAEVLQEALVSGEFSMAMMTITSDRNDASGYLERFGSGSDENYGYYHDNAYDMLMRVAATSNSVVARDAYLEDAEKLLLESGYVIPLYNNTHHWLIRSDLAGAIDNGQDVHYFAYMRVLQQVQ